MTMIKRTFPLWRMGNINTSAFLESGNTLIPVPCPLGSAYGLPAPRAAYWLSLGTTGIRSELTSRVNYTDAAVEPYLDDAVGPSPTADLWLTTGVASQGSDFIMSAQRMSAIAHSLPSPGPISLFKADVEFVADEPFSMGTQAATGFTLPWPTVVGGDGGHPTWQSMPYEALAINSSSTGVADAATSLLKRSGLITDATPTPLVQFASRSTCQLAITSARTGNTVLPAPSPFGLAVYQVEALYSLAPVPTSPKDLYGIALASTWLPGGWWSVADTWSFTVPRPSAAPVQWAVSDVGLNPPTSFAALVPGNPWALGVRAWTGFADPNSSSVSYELRLR